MSPMRKRGIARFRARHDGCASSHAARRSWPYPPDRIGPRRPRYLAAVRLLRRQAIRGFTRPVAPVVEPEDIADAVYEVVRCPRREVWVGLSTLKVILGIRCCRSGSIIIARRWRSPRRRRGSR
jgi:hypothetical protein